MACNLSQGGSNFMPTNNTRIAFLIWGVLHMYSIGSLQFMLNNILVVAQ